MRQVNAEKLNKYNEMRNRFNLYAEKIVENIPPLQLNGITVKLTALMRDIDYHRLLPVHEHPDFELCFNDVGKFTNYAEGTHNDFFPNKKHALLIPPGVLHSRKYCAAATINTTFRFYIESSDIDTTKIHTLLSEYILKNNFQLPVNEKLENLYKTVFSLKHDLNRENIMLDCRIISAFLYGILQPLGLLDISASTGDKNEKNSPDLLINKIKLLVAKYNNAKFFSHDFLRYKFDLSSNYLNRVFRQKTGMTIRRYWEIQRLKNIQKLIEDTDMPFSNIAQMLKFATPTQFSKYVKKHFNQTPILCFGFY